MRIIQRSLILSAIILLGAVTTTHNAARLHPMYVDNTEIHAIEDKKDTEITEETINEPVSVRTMTFEVTAYTDAPEENGNDLAMTAMGTPLRHGVVACNDLPLGTRIRIDGNEYVVEDRMAYSGVIDIFMESYHDAIQWGRRVKEVEIIE